MVGRERVGGEVVLKHLYQQILLLPLRPIKPQFTAIPGNFQAKQEAIAPCVYVCFITTIRLVTGEGVSWRCRRLTVASPVICAVR